VLLAPPSPWWCHFCVHVVIECETKGKSRSGYSVEKDFLDSAFVHLLLDSGPKGSDKRLNLF